MDLNTLRRFSEVGYEALPPYDFIEAAIFCRDYGSNLSDLSFIILESCFRLSAGFWSEGESGVAPASQAGALQNVWLDRLPAILALEDRDEAASLVRSLQQKIRLICSSPP